jgi:hypothetical protein
VVVVYVGEKLQQEELQTAELLLWLSKNTHRAAIEKGCFLPHFSLKALRSFLGLLAK